MRYNMGMAFSFSREIKKKEELILVCDVGSASAGCALVAVSPDAKSKILFDARADMVFQEELDLARFQDAVVKAVGDAAASVLKKGIPHLAFTRFGMNRVPKKIFCVLSSPWYATQTRVREEKRAEPFRITEKIINDLIESEIEAFKKSPDVARIIGQEDILVIEKKRFR